MPSCSDPKHCTEVPACDQSGIYVSSTGMELPFVTESYYVYSGLYKPVYWKSWFITIGIESNKTVNRKEC